VTAGIKLEVGPPAEINPNEGILGFSSLLFFFGNACLDVTVHLTPLCSPRFAIGKPSEEALSLAEFISRTLLTCVFIIASSKLLSYFRTGALDMSTLCIERKKVVWVARLDVVFLDYDGNANDAGIFLCLPS
jgi:exosome complex RNA-binding protein Rrp42 (RNase PH superfamily)